MSTVFYAIGSVILLGVAIGTGNFPLALASAFFVTGSILAMLGL